MLLNLNIRAYEPSSVHHIIAVVCLILSGLMGGNGFQLLRTEGSSTTVGTIRRCSISKKRPFWSQQEHINTFATRCIVLSFC